MSMRDVTAKPYVPHPQADARRASAIRLAQASAMAEGVLDGHRRRALSNAVWWYTEADGKFKVRYRSEAALTAGPHDKVQHEHVVTRRFLVDHMLMEPERIPEIMASSLACLVTAEEHRRLSQVPSDVEGWDRYKAAGVVVIDATTNGRLLFD